MIAMVLVVAILLLLIISASGVYFEASLKSYRNVNSRLLALQVLQDYAELAQKAHAVYVTYNSTVPAPGGCPVNYVQNPAGLPFCWLNQAGADCVRIPTDSTAANPNLAIANVPFCLTAPVTNAQTIMDMTALYIQPRFTRWQQLQAMGEQFLIDSSHVARVALHKLSGGLDQRAWAQLAAAYHPTMVGAPTNDITLYPCNAGASGDTYCKRCAGAPGTTMDCINLKVCMLISRVCPNPQDWYNQRVGVMNR